MHDDKVGGQLAEELSAAQGKLEKREAETGHRRLEGMLQEASPLNRLLLDALPTVAVLLRPNREIVACNEAAVKASAVPGTRCFETWGQRREPCPWCLAPVALATGEAQHLEVEALGKVWDAHWLPMGSDLYLHFAFDITDRRRASEALRESESRFRAVFEKAAFGMALVAPDGRLVDVNTTLQGMLGYSRQELQGIHFTDLTHPDDVAASLQLHQQLVAGGRDHSQMEKRHVRKDGETVWSRLTVFLSRGAKGEPQFIIAMVEDISRRKLLEEQLLRAQRLETAGRIAGQVAHDFSNLLGPLVSYPDLIRERLPKDHPAVTLCDLMQEAAQQMVEINANMMALGRRGVVDRQPTDLNRVIEEDELELKGFQHRFRPVATQRALELLEGPRVGQQHHQG